MTLRKINIAVCGLGTVGGGTVNLLRDNAALIASRSQCELNVVQVGARRPNPDCDTGAIAVTADIFDVLTNPDVEVVVELIGGTTVAYDLVMGAIASGKHVVTANKALIAEHGGEIFAAAAKAGVMVGYEAAVAGGIPIIKALREGLAGNRVNWIAGIINGTTNFILSEMASKGTPFAKLLSDAQAKGYAEADPTFDIEGIDAAHKLVILASLGFGIPLSIEGLYSEGITKLEPLDVAYADELGYKVKHLGIARQSSEGVELRVHPTLVPHSSLISDVDGVLNAVMVNSDALGTTLYSGPGAGALPTASSVVADLIDMARRINCAPESWPPALGVPVAQLTAQPMLAIEQIDTAFYIRFAALDKPGVLSAVTKIMGDAGISIEAIIQREQPVGEQFVNVIILTDVTKEQQLEGAVAAIEALDTVRDSVTFIRVEHLDQ